MEFCFCKRPGIFFITFVLIIGLMAGSAFATGFETGSGGMSNDSQSAGIFAATGTGGGGNTGVQVNVSVVIGTGGASYLQGDQSVSPHVVLSASEPVDVFISVVFDDIVLGYNPLPGFGGNPWTTNFTPSFTDSIDLTLFDYPAASLAVIFPEETFIPFGVFVRVVEAGTGVNGTILGEASALTYIANLPPMPALPQAPWQSTPAP